MNPHNALLFSDLTPIERDALDHAVAQIPDYLDHNEVYDFNEADPNSDQEDG